MVETLWFTRDVARITGKSEGAIYEAVRAGLFPPGVVIRLGRAVRFSPDRLSAWLHSGGSQWPGGWRREPKKRAELTPKL